MSAAPAMKTPEAVLGELYLALNLDEASRQDCWALWQAVAAAIPPPTSEPSLRRLMTSCLYFSLRSPDRKNPDSAPFITVSHLLAAASLDLVTFTASLKDMKTLFESLPAVAHVATAVAPALSGLAIKYCVISGFWVRYNQLFTSLFGTEGAVDGGRHGNLRPYMHELGWIALLVARNAAFGQTDYTEQLVAMHAIMIAVLAHVAEYGRHKLSLDPAQFTLAALCEKDAAAVDEAQRVDQLYVAPLFKAPDLHALHREYAAAYLASGYFDEKLFLSSDPQLVPTASTTAATAGSGQVPVVFTGTPIRAAIKTFDKFREALAARTTSPSPALTAIFDACHTATAPAVLCADVVQRARGPFVEQYSRRLGPAAMADRRYDDAVRLFYRYLETISLSERARLQRADLSPILANVTFLRALLCCSLDIVLFVYGSAQVGREEQVDWVLAGLDVHAFDFLKVLETVVRSEDCLTESLATHARALEERIVVTLVWQLTSPLWTALQRTPLHVSPPSHRGFLSPGRAPLASPQASPAPGADPAYHLSEAAPLDNTDQANVRAISFFSRKLMRVAQSNLRKIAQRLKLPSEATSLSFAGVQHALSDHPQLIENLHLDYIILSCIYSVCKLLDHACPFKSIVFEYRRLDWPCPAPCRAIALPSGPGDVIDFYNEVFLPKMKTFMFDLVSRRQPDMGTASPRVARSVLDGRARPATHAGMTPHTAMLHCSLESPFRVSTLSATALTSSPMQRKRLFVEAAGAETETSQGQGGIRQRLSMLRRAASAPTHVASQPSTDDPASSQDSILDSSQT